MASITRYVDASFSDLDRRLDSRDGSVLLYKDDFAKSASYRVAVYREGDLVVKLEARNLDRQVGIKINYGKMPVSEVKRYLDGILLTLDSPEDSPRKELKPAA